MGWSSDDWPVTQTGVKREREIEREIERETKIERKRRREMEMKMGDKGKGRVIKLEERVRVCV